MGKTVLIAFLSVALAGPALAAPLKLDCIADRACVAGLDVVCDRISLPHSLDVGRRSGDKVVVTTEEGDKFYEFRRLANADGVLLQAAGGALEQNQGSGALTVFDDLRFVLTRHSRIVLDEAAEQSEVVSISIHGTCAERE